jgi:hypothetical protein
MESWLFLLAIIALVVIFHWLFVNERGDGPTKGLLRMRGDGAAEHKEKTGPTAKRRRTGSEGV